MSELSTSTVLVDAQGAAALERLGRPSRIDQKRAFDLTLALTLLFILMPIILTMMILAMMAQGRPLFIGHRRVGRHGTTFPCFKFRTMLLNGDEILREHLSRDPDAKIEWEATRKLKNDPRVTRLGYWMRKSSVDELPQLLNVLRGEMSIVGPRPVVEQELERYGGRVGSYTCVRPGITGSWQVCGRSNLSYDLRVELDAKYSADWTLKKDVVILFKTIPAVLRSTGSY